jgi:hypothetical protein
LTPGDFLFFNLVGARGFKPRHLLLESMIFCHEFQVIQSKVFDINKVHIAHDSLNRGVKEVNFGVLRENLGNYYA